MPPKAEGIKIHPTLFVFMAAQRVPILALELLQLNLNWNVVCVPKDVSFEDAKIKPNTQKLSPFLFE